MLAKICAAVFFIVFLNACGSVPTPPVPPPTFPLPPTPLPVPTISKTDSQFLPNPTLTPGALNPSVSQNTIQSTVCVPGYSSSIRPPVAYTDNLKRTQLADPRYGDTADQNPANYEEDHFIPLAVGGNPTDPNNLWPQPRNTQPYNAVVKDTLEYTLYKMVCAGQISLADAQNAVVTDWVQAYRTYVSGNLGILPFKITPEP